jgi:hypothetical protein
MGKKKERINSSLRVTSVIILQYAWCNIPGVNNVLGYRLCGIVVIVPGYRSKGPGSIPNATRFSEK